MKKIFQVHSIQNNEYTDVLNLKRFSPIINTVEKLYLKNFSEFNYIEKCMYYLPFSPLERDQLG